MRSPLVGLAAGAPLSLDEFIITYFLIGGHDTLPIYIYTQVKFGITPEVNAVATMLLAASLAILGLAFALPQLLRLGQRAVRIEREPQTGRAEPRAWTGGAIASQTTQLGSAAAAGPNRSRNSET
jgi:ABC-type Fe3+ transport system permease subunit